VPSPFRFDRSWHFGLGPAELWATLAQTDRYRAWWPWLREFRLDGGGDALTTGAVAHVVIQAPLPYQLRCTIRVDDATATERLATRVGGDLTGPAHLELRASEDGTDARLAWELELRAPVLRSLAIVARPAMAWAHDRIVERGLAQFEGHARRGRDRLA
jgi:Polyketide cyclase / dehydrase and lipid transport